MIRALLLLVSSAVTLAVLLGNQHDKKKYKKNQAACPDCGVLRWLLK